MSSKLVSVIIPNYNSINFIKETLDSVFDQSYENIEIIIVDDGSTDGSFEYIDNLNRANLKLVKNLMKGACSARNQGLLLAMGDYIQFLDADDLLQQNKIEVQVELLENYDNCVAVCSTKHFYGDISKSIVADTHFLYSTNKPLEFLLNLYGADGKQYGMVAQHSWLAPKQVIDRAGFWDESLIKDQDGEFFCRVVMASKGVCYARNTVCYYRKHKKAGSISSGKSSKHLMSQLQSLNSKEAQLAIAKDTQAYKNAMGLQYKIIAIDAYSEHKAIFDTAINKVKYFGGSSYEPVLGGRVIESVKHIFGWRTAKAFSQYIHTNKIIKRFLK